MKKQPNLNVGIFGPGMSGKTTLAKELSISMFRQGFPSIKLDPNKEDWGKHCTNFTDETLFQTELWKRERHCIFMEEATETIARDKGKNSLFTRIRHRGHKLFVIGHSGSNLLPIQREQLHTLFLFKQPMESADYWYRLFGDERLLQSVNLRQYEFMHFILFGDNGLNYCKKSILKLV